MDLKPDFTFRPLPPVAQPDHFPFEDIPSPLGPLSYLPGTWTGTGFNTIWRPFFGVPDHHRFLELNLTDETTEFSPIGGAIPNRGLLQKDLIMFGLHYLQQISDANVRGNPGLHIEPGVWLAVPRTTNPEEPPTVVRMGSIPHGTTILAQGTGTGFSGPPTIPPMNIVPISNTTGSPLNFDELDIYKKSDFRIPPEKMPWITQEMIENPASVLTDAIAGQTILMTQQLTVSTKSTPPVVGSSIASTAFLLGTTDGPNADPVRVEATFWIELVEGRDGQPDFFQLQYAQTVFLVFDKATWPHVTVATLRKVKDMAVPIQQIDPDIPVELLQRSEGAAKP